MNPHPILSRFRKIKAIVLDVDGVFTDGSMTIEPPYTTLRTYNIKDGLGVKTATDAGLLVIVISGAGDDLVHERMRRLGITEIHLNVDNKEQRLKQLMELHHLLREEVMYMGDDVVDIEAMKLTGLICCPSDAVNDIRGIADYVSPYPGGRGCLRDITEKVLRLQGKWVA